MWTFNYIYVNVILNKKKEKKNINIRTLFTYIANIKNNICDYGSTLKFNSELDIPRTVDLLFTRRGSNNYNDNRIVIRFEVCTLFLLVSNCIKYTLLFNKI